MGVDTTRVNDNPFDFEDIENQNVLDADEHIVYSGCAVKKNEHGFEFDKIYVITDKCFYSMESRTEVSRKVALSKIVGVTVSTAPECSKLVVHVHRERDICVEFVDKVARSKFVGQLLGAAETCKHFEVYDTRLSKFCMTETEVRQGLKSKMPNDNYRVKEGCGEDRI